MTGNESKQAVDERVVAGHYRCCIYVQVRDLAMVLLLSLLALDA